jgi:hypothetical protein
MRWLEKKIMVPPKSIQGQRLFQRLYQFDYNDDYMVKEYLKDDKKYSSMILLSH